MDNISRFQKTTGVGQILDESFARCPEREAIVFGDWRITYRELQALIYRTAHCLRSLGIAPGDRVAIISRNCPEVMIAEIAILKLGGTVVKFNWRLAPEEMIYLLDLNEVRLLQAGARGLGRRPAAALCRTHHVPVPDAGSRRPLRPLFPARRYAGHAGGDRRCARRPRLPHAHEWHDRAAEVRGLLPRALSQPA